MGYKQSSGADSLLSVVLKVDVVADNTPHGTLFVCEETLASTRGAENSTYRWRGTYTPSVTTWNRLLPLVEPYAYVDELSWILYPGVMPEQILARTESISKLH